MAEYYQGQVTAYVLDDSASPELKAMARDFGFAYATRPNRGWFKKSGNLLVRASRSPTGRLHPAARRRFRAPPRPAGRGAAVDGGATRTRASCRPRSSSGSPTTRPGSSGAPGRCRSCSTAPSRRPGPRRAAPSAWAAAPFTGGRRWHDNLGMTLAEHSEDVRTGFDLSRLGWTLRYLPDRGFHWKLPGQCAGVPESAIPLVLGNGRAAIRANVLAREAELLHTNVLSRRICLLHLHGVVHIRHARAFHHHSRLSMPNGLMRLEEHDLHHPGGALLRGDLPDVASRAVPARGLGGQADLGLGARVRVLGRDPGQAAGLEAFGRRQEEAGRAGASGPASWSGPWAAAWPVDRPGVLPHGHHEPRPTSSSCSASGCSSSWSRPGSSSSRTRMRKLR